MTRYDYTAIAARLDRLADVPTDVLFTLVTRDGLCFWAFDRHELPELTGQGTPDRELAAGMCAGCPVTDACLLLELRTAGEATVGVWGALPETDRRAVYRAWKIRHPNRRSRGGDWE